MNAREFDIILLGATGYTGAFCLDHIRDASNTSLKGITIAIAGRSRSKVAAAAKQAGVEHLPIVVADTTDANSMDECCRRCSVLVSVVGPYTQYGWPVVEACVRNATTLIDATGEFTYQARIAEKFHDEARRNKFYLISACAFDALPSTLTNLFLHRRWRSNSDKNNKNNKQQHQQLQHVALGWRLKNPAGFSGGTMLTTATMLWTLHLADANPLSLLPSCTDPKSAPPPDDLKEFITPPGGFPVQLGIRWSQVCSGYKAPFLMGGTNEKNARKDNVLLGINASYYEFVVERNVFMAIVWALMMYIFVPLLALPLIGTIIRKLFLPAPGSGPSREALAKSSFEAVAAGYTNPTGQGVPAITCRMISPDDSYIVSGKFLLETAAAVIKGELNSEAKRPNTSWSGGGVVTPAALVGDSLGNRMERCGLRWEFS